MPMTSDELKALVRGAFPVEPRPRSKEITDEGDTYWERVELRRELKGKAWPEVPMGILRRECGTEMTWLSPKGFRYYLPAWLVAALDDGNVLSGVLGALEPQDRPDLQEFFLRHISELDAAQTEAVIAFLEHVHAAPDGGVIDHLDRARVTTSLPFWHARRHRARGGD
jgi:Family of unknown function (DUF6714)